MLFPTDMTDVFKTQICQREFDFCESRGFGIRAVCRTHGQRSIARAVAFPGSTTATYPSQERPAGTELRHHICRYSSILRHFS